MNKYLVILLVMTCCSFEAHSSSEKNANKQGANTQMNTTISATEWKHMYFLAITKKKPSEINLSQELMSGLLSMINVHSGISTGAAIEPKYLINAKGTTVWLAMYALVASSNPDALNSLHSGEGLLYVPSAFLNGAFGNHINWPEKMLQSHNLELKNYNLLAIPFIVSNSATNMKQMPQSLKAPDGSLEVFGFHEFSEKNPEALLIEYESIINFIGKSRPDVINATP